MAKKKQKKQVVTEKTQPDITVSSGKQGHPVSFLSSVSSVKLLAFALCVSAVCLVPVLTNGFLTFDDPVYVTENLFVQHFNIIAVKKFFSEQFEGTYQPVVMLCYAIEYKLFGMNAGGFHFFSLLIHLLNVVLVFLLTKRFLNSPVAATVTALLFGIHPLHVEPVAWIASQKDVVYAFFFLASSLCYLKFIQQDNSRKYYLLAILLFILSLLSKAQAVVLPVIFLLFDYFLKRKINAKSLLEKLPFFALSIIFGIVALVMQKEIGAIRDFSFYPSYEHVLYASYSFVCYLMQAIIPVKLSIFYPFPVSAGQNISSFVYITPFIIIALGALVFIFRKRIPLLVFGLLFFCVTILLVIQFKQVGSAVRADRYSYIPLIGIFMYAGHIFVTWYERRPAQQKVITAIAAIYFVVLGTLTFNRANVFKDSLTVYNDALEHYPSTMIYYNRGCIFYNNKQYKEALNDFVEVEKNGVASANVWFYTGECYRISGNLPKAIQDYEAALKTDSNNVDIYMDLQTIHIAQNDLNAALKDANKIIELKPDKVEAYFNRGDLLGRLGKIKEAIPDLNKAISMNPGYTDAYHDRAIANSMAGDNTMAIKDFNKVLELKPDNWKTYFDRSIALKTLGQYADAYKDAMKAKNNGFPVDKQYLNELRSLIK
jgi:tetratricopeptide (TPR) repeat protein